MGTTKNSGGTMVDSVCKFVRNLLPQGASNQESDAVTQVILLGVVPSKEDDPVAFLSVLSDATLDKLMKKISSCKNSLKRLKSSVSKAIQDVIPFFIAEWGRRHGFLSTWSWKWDESEDGGRMIYRPGHRHSLWFNRVLQDPSALQLTTAVLQPS